MHNNSSYIDKSSSLLGRRLSFYTMFTGRIWLFYNISFIPETSNGPRYLKKNIEMGVYFLNELWSPYPIKLSNPFLDIQITYYMANTFIGKDIGDLN